MQLFDAVEERGVVEIGCDLCLDDDLNEVLPDTSIGDISVAEVRGLLAVDQNVGQVSAISAR